ncbi:unnamed protein product [Ceutorhynchus assimilis]|uniref:PIF1/LRR1 pleckstrin homology domain-containing protein n=1 Tax=Ceutorhynchus assimilis TaxID=467358 RepID=A0A9N9MGD4_9CUCU|nr:unnamed protein product [Ceutorhynchus assimilis]
MKIPCTVLVADRSMPTLPANLRRKPCKSTLALCKHPKNEEFFLLLFSGQNKNGTKYNLKDNLKQVLTKFVDEGKFTVQLKNPEHDLCVQGDVIQVKGFLHLLRRALEGKVSAKEMTFSSMSVTPVKAKDIAPIKLVINKRLDYPSKGFPRTLESVYINDLKCCSLPKGILQLQKLKILDLSNNSIEFLPEELNKLPNLKELNMSYNLLGKGTLKQWQWLGGCLSKSLSTLDLSNNTLTFLPDQLVKLHNLTKLNLNNNRLKLLPAGIGNLRNLKILSANSNLLTILPGSIKKLTLQAIDVSENNFEQNVPVNYHNFQLPVCSLKEYAAKKVLWSRIPYPKGSLPSTLIDYLDYAKYCICGKACFTVVCKQRHNLSLSSISETVNTMANETVYVPIDCYFCSRKCFLQTVIKRFRIPIAR